MSSTLWGTKTLDAGADFQDKLHARQLFELVRATVRDALDSFIGQEMPPTTMKMVEVVTAAMTGQFRIMRECGLVEDPQYDVALEAGQIVIRSLNDEAKRICGMRIDGRSPEA